MILAAYRAWGESCVNRLIGDFAFAIWNPIRRRLFAARDVSGSRQMYAYEGGGKLYLVTERAQAFQDPTIPFEIDDEQLIEFLTPSYTYYSGWDLGFLRGFRAVPAGFQLVAGVDRERVSLSRFWTWKNTATDHRSREAVLENYKDTLEQAVQCRLRSRSPVAIELSGGLDSSAVAALAARLADNIGPALHTISHVFDETPEVDERPRIQDVLDSYPQLLPRFVSADRLFGPQCIRPDWSPAGIVGPYEAWLPAVIPHSYGLAVESGCRVVLTGDCGDTLNEGCDRAYYSLMRRRDWREVLRWLGIDWRKGKVRAARRVIVHGILPLLAPLPILRAGLLTWERWRWDPNWSLPAFIPTRLSARIQEVDRAIRLEQLGTHLVSCPSVRSTFERLLPPMISVTAKYPVPIDVRRPYLDLRLIEMVLSMPQEMMWDPEEVGGLCAGRLHHREAMHGIIPERVRVGNIGAEFGPAIRKSNPTSVLREWLLGGATIHVFERGYVIPELFLTAIDHFEKGRSREETAYIMSMISLEGWLRGLSSGGNMHRLIPPRAVISERPGNPESQETVLQF